MEKDILTLKWGALKEWSFHSDKGLKLLKEYGEIGSTLSVIFPKDTPRQKEILCELIDEGNFKEVFLDWDDKYVSKKKAKDYINNYK